MSAENATDLTSDMVNVVENGTAAGARINGVEVAGKTGTAETDGNSLHLWFIAFAPSDNPEIAVAVMLENQPLQDEQTGGAFAAPIARSMIATALDKGK
jgi:peptidoglycan glycosyltransferase